MPGLRRKIHPDLGEAEKRPSLGQLFTRDFARIDDEQQESAARERIRALEPVPAFLLGVHLICAVAFLVGLGNPADPNPALLAPLGALIALDFGLWAYLWRNPLSRLAPHVAIRAAALYSLVAYGLWCAASVAAGPNHAQNLTLLDLAVAGGVLALPIAFLSYPALVALGCLGFAAKFWFLSQDVVGAGATVLLSALLVRLSLARSADRIAQLRKRTAMDWHAQRAARFIEEFEQAGRGWFWETTARGALSYVSEQIAADLKTPAADLIGKNFIDLIGLDDRRGSESSERTLGFHLSTRLPFTDINVRANTTAEIWWSLSGTPSFDEYGRFLGFRGIGTDLTQQRRSEEEINRLAKYDSLTNLPNRMLMRRTLDETLQKKGDAAGGGCALFLIDLDRFKNVNDTLGHPVGDALLKQVAQRLTSVIGKIGQVGRLGGDEFEAVLPGKHDDAALGDLANRLIQQVSMPYMIEGHNISIGASVGIALAPSEGCCADALIRNADLALYAAKSAGRGTYCFFAPEMHSEAQDRQTLEADLRKAIARGELQLQYQPVVNAQTEELSGFEALVRWHHPTRGVVSPALFVPLAEEAGLILSIGEWVLRTACLEAAKWPEHIRVAVNLSPIQFVEPALPATVMSAIANAGIQPRQLELEITEGVFLAENDATDDMFAKLKNIGVRLALDDFGTGYSSLGYLKKAPFDKIKIDQSFVRGAAKSGSRNAAIIRAIVTLAESLSMDTTAEGAETHDELTMIRELGCSHIQGYIFGRPMNPEDAGRLAAENKAVTADGFQFNRPPRQGILKVASLQFNGMSMPVRVRNISTGGALLECDRMLPLESKVQLDLPGCGNLGAEVRWSEAKRMGVQFEDEFDLRRLQPGKGAGFGAKLPASGYTNLKYADAAANKRALSAGDLRYGKGG
ncbi:MAG TPA: EAL domain-containing protein [Allosphingosinicella sp.]|nr:EAL domain-containing protein [Allosphingosinicella sp.]